MFILCARKVYIFLSPAETKSAYLYGNTIPVDALVRRLSRQVRCDVTALAPAASTGRPCLKLGSGTFFPPQTLLPP